MDSMRDCGMCALHAREAPISFARGGTHPERTSYGSVPLFIWEDLMSHRSRFTFVAAAVTLIVAVGLLSGCGKGGPRGLEKLVPVSGIVTVGDTPLNRAGVSFRGDASKGNSTRHIPVGQTDAQGRYELTTAGQKGAPPGWYKVLVIVSQSDMQPPGGGTKEPPKAAPSPIGKKYATADTTDLSIEVKDGAGAGAYDLKLSK
jgi:hypothetical protein